MFPHIWKGVKIKNVLLNRMSVHMSCLTSQWKHLANESNCLKTTQNTLALRRSNTASYPNTSVVINITNVPHSHSSVVFVFYQAEKTHSHTRDFKLFPNHLEHEQAS